MILEYVVGGGDLLQQQALQPPGDLTGLSRLRFDVVGHHPLRFRIVYRLIENDTVIEVLAIGERADLSVYRDTFARLDPAGDDTGRLA